MRRVTRAVLAFGVLFALAGCVVEPMGAAPPPPPRQFPRLNAAEQQIRIALGELRAAPPIYGGRKAAAVRLLVDALHQIEMAKAYRR